MNDCVGNVKIRLESLKTEALAAIKSGNSDADGIPQHACLKLVAPVIDYIYDVAATLPEEDVEDTLERVLTDDEYDIDYVVSCYIGLVGLAAKNQYVGTCGSIIDRARRILNDEIEVESG